MCPCLCRTCQEGHENIANPTYVAPATEQDGVTSRQTQQFFFLLFFLDTVAAIIARGKLDTPVCLGTSQSFLQISAWAPMQF